MTDRVATLLLELASFAWGDAATCWPSNATLARRLGKHVGTVKRIVADAEARGFIRRVDGPRGRAFILAWKADAGGSGSAPPPARQRSPQAGAEARPEVALALEPAPSDAAGPEGAALPQRQRPQAPVEASPPPDLPPAARAAMLDDNQASIEAVSAAQGAPVLFAVAEPLKAAAAALSGRLEADLDAMCSSRPAAPPTPPRPARERMRDRPAPTRAPGPQEPLTPGQVLWLSTLDEGQRGRFAGLGAGLRQELLALHADGPNAAPEALLMVRDYLSPRKASPGSRAMPETTGELLAALPHGEPGWVHAAADALVRDFGTEKDRHLRPAFVKLATEVWQEQTPAERVVDAYNQAMGPKVRNRGAVFNTALRRTG